MAVAVAAVAVVAVVMAVAALIEEAVLWMVAAAMVARERIEGNGEARRSCPPLQEGLAAESATAPRPSFDELLDAAHLTEALRRCERAWSHCSTPETVLRHLDRLRVLAAKVNVARRARRARDGRSWLWKGFGRACATTITRSGDLWEDRGRRWKASGTGGYSVWHRLARWCQTVVGAESAAPRCLCSSGSTDIGGRTTTSWPTKGEDTVIQ